MSCIVKGVSGVRLPPATGKHEEETSNGEERCEAAYCQGI